MCELIENICTFWGNTLDWSYVRANDPNLTFCFASPRQGEEGWQAYDTPQLDPARVTQLDIEQCKALAEEARTRGHWEMAKLISLAVGTALATLVLYVGLCMLIAVVTLATVYVFAQLAVLVMAVSEPIAVAIAIVGLVIAMAGFVNGIPAAIVVLHCTWTKEGVPQISRSYAYMQHLYTRSRELEILGARDPDPAEAVGGA